jgi:hypothetical protein
MSKEARLLSPALSSFLRQEEREISPEIKRLSDLCRYQWLKRCVNETESSSVFR